MLGLLFGRLGKVVREGDGPGDIGDILIVVFDLQSVAEHLVNGFLIGKGADIVFFHLNVEGHI